MKKQPSTPSFVAFLAQLGVKLSPGQRVLWSVIADGLQPHALTAADCDIARSLFGDVDTIPPNLLDVVAIVKGARIGGSYLAALRLLYLGLTVPLKLAPGEEAFGAIIAPSLELAEQTLRYVSGAVKAAPALAARMEKNDSSSVTIRRDDGQLVTIKCFAASRGGTGGRSRTLFGALLDEAAFFRDESSVVNDGDIYRAVSPRIVPGGQLIVFSTPWAEAGVLYDLFSKNHGAPTTCVAAHAPTVLMRSDNAKVLATVKREYENDPENAAREFGAEFMTRGAGLFFDGAAIDAAIDRTLILPAAPIGRMTAAVDPGFARDSSTFVAVADHDGLISVRLIDELRPAKGVPLQPSAVVAHWAALAKLLGLTSVRSDIHYRESVREHMTTHGLTLEDVPEGQAGKRAMYERTRTLLNEGRLRLPLHPRLLRQLREVMVRPTPGGGMTISSPRRGGDHGDLVSALVAAVWAIDEGSSVATWLAAMDTWTGF
jgi:hypothetical protein